MNIIIITGNSLLNYINNTEGASNIALIAILLTAIVAIIQLFNIDIKEIFKNWFNVLIDNIGIFTYKKELKYKRELEIGKINEKQNKVKIYRFFNDLIIDLGLKRMGVNPTSFILIILITSLIIAAIVCKSVFDNMVLIVFAYPLILVALTCVLYTKANIAHDLRIDAVIESQNIISNNIKGGVKLSISNNINLIPEIVRREFEDFLDNVDHKNYHINVALMELNNNIGSVANEFIKKCIEFETGEEHGVAGMFEDVVELNNIKTELRNDMKLGFEQINSKFIMGALMIFVFLGGVIFLFENVRNFYFNNPIGQLIIILDALAVIGVFVYITYLRAKEL